MEISMVLHLPRDAVSVSVCRQVLDSCLETLGVAADTRDDIALALGEACANVVQHAGPGDEYEVRVGARNRRCVIEVVNTSQDGVLAPGPAAGTPAVAGDQPDGQRGGQPDGLAEHGRGLQIIDAVADNVRLTGDRRHGTTTVHFEKTLEWVPEAAGQHLLSAGQ